MTRRFLAAILLTLLATSPALADLRGSGLATGGGTLTGPLQFKGTTGGVLFGNGDVPGSYAARLWANGSIYEDNVQDLRNLTRAVQATITCTTTNGSAAVTGCDSTVGLSGGNFLTGPGITEPTSITGGTITGTGFTMSHNAGAGAGTGTITVHGACGNAATKYTDPVYLRERAANGYSSPASGCQGFYPNSYYMEVGNLNASPDSDDTDVIIVDTHLAGTTNLPSTQFKAYQFQSSTNKHFWRHSAAYPGSTGAVAMEFDSETGRLGVGMASPNNAIEAAGAAGDAVRFTQTGVGAVFLGYASTEAVISTDQNAPFTFRTSVTSSNAGSGAVQFRIGATASAVNFAKASGAATGNAVVLTTVGGDASPTLQINPLGNTMIGTGAALATNATTGMLLIPSMAGTPTGTVGALGQVALVYDSTNKKLCVTIGATVECTAAMLP